MERIPIPRENPELLTDEQRALRAWIDSLDEPQAEALFECLEEVENE